MQECDKEAITLCPLWLFVPPASDLISRGLQGLWENSTSPAPRGVKGAKTSQQTRVSSSHAVFLSTSLLPLKLRVTGSWQSNTGRRENQTMCFCILENRGAA